MDSLKNHIEALIFCSESALTIKEIAGCLNQVSEEEISVDDIEQALVELSEDFEQPDRAISLNNIGGGYQLLTKPAYQFSVGVLLARKAKKRLSVATLETISIIAYKQPITKPEIERIRGVNCDYSIQKLLEKELITIKGKSESVGKPLLYGVSDKFMDYFGISSLDQLPTLKEFASEGNMVGSEDPDEFAEKEKQPKLGLADEVGLFEELSESELAELKQDEESSMDGDVQVVATETGIPEEVPEDITSQQNDSTVTNSQSHADTEITVVENEEAGETVESNESGESPQAASDENSDESQIEEESHTEEESQTEEEPQTEEESHIEEETSSLPESDEEIK